MARLRKAPPEQKLALDVDAAVALIDRHVAEYEWLVERAKVEAKIANLEEQLAYARSLNPNGLDVPTLEGHYRRLAEQVEQARFALGADFGARGATGPALWGDEPDAA